VLTKKKDFITLSGAIGAVEQLFSNIAHPTRRATIPVALPKRSPVRFVIYGACGGVKVRIIGSRSAFGAPRAFSEIAGIKPASTVNKFFSNPLWHHQKLSHPPLLPLLNSVD